MLDITIQVLPYVPLVQSESQLAQPLLVDQPAHAYQDSSYHHPTVTLAQETLLHAQLMLLFQHVIVDTH